MLPIFARVDGTTRLVPLLQLVFDQLFDFGFRKFCFVVGRDKRVIEDHFTFDLSFAGGSTPHERRNADPVLQFHLRTNICNIVWVNQPKPLGFGHAVLTAESVMSGRPFVVHAGDTLIYSSRNSHLRRLVRVHERMNADVTLLLNEVSNPKHYGVAEVTSRKGAFVVERVVEKPSKPRSNFAMVGIYAFGPSIFSALRNTKMGKEGELQLTDGIQGMIDQGRRVVAVRLEKDEVRLDIGDPEYYWQALRTSHEKALSGRNLHAG